MYHLRTTGTKIRRHAEAVRYLTGFAAPISAGKLWLVDFATGQTGVGYEWPCVPGCPVCGAGFDVAAPAGMAAMEAL